MANLISNPPAKSAVQINGATSSTVKTAGLNTKHSYDFDVLVIGGGPGGEPAALRASQLGLRVAAIERDRLGGICTNWGCIPTKALLKNAEIYKDFLDAPKEWGITYDNLRVDFSAVIKRSRGVTDKNVRGIEYLFKKNKVELINGTGVLTSANTVEVTGKDGAKRTVSAARIIIATGARARMLPGIKPDGKRILTSTEAMVMDHIPESMTIVGSGAIGIEFAYFFHTFGTKITIIEMMPNILPIEDTEVSAELEKIYKKQGMTIYTNTKVSNVSIGDKGTIVEIETADGKKEKIDAECTLVAIGVQGNTENIGLEKLGFKMTKGFIDVDEYMRTSVAGVYAVGDVAGPPWLAHVATAEGLVAAEHIAHGEAQPVDYDNIPGCTYCQPQVASVGLTERAAKEEGIQIKIGKFPFTASGKARAIGHTEGFVKLIFDEKYGELLGAHILGSEATEMLEELTLARSHGATSESILKTIHPHPTLSEAVMEAASVAMGEAIHI
ncbi:MAG: dihydrolipoyl dehydrogenase [Bacteroidota bacterium]|nr:dihydrolipoyl dehydrogenase [Bacteroidota bacterium]MDP4229721.1 dihydrolipoyl dehydrogenase [Bacteroidota bacterium]MDP4235776.1 dihydrolipoyl dehydrogenase [Bacteroidota bacterium]